MGKDKKTTIMVKKDTWNKLRLLKISLDMESLNDVIEYLIECGYKEVDMVCREND
ncbi:MAG: hypothetical protein J7K98_03350 [Candidatus Aenigmarchaeota archaeon]|nr:hypothetical protein [Candidatus Aenigmarchaeota archaeon]